MIRLASMYRLTNLKISSLLAEYKYIHTDDTNISYLPGRNRPTDGTECLGRGNSAFVLGESGVGSRKV